MLRIIQQKQFQCRLTLKCGLGAGNFDGDDFGFSNLTEAMQM
jgi:hypothetical protein